MNQSDELPLETDAATKSDYKPPSWVIWQLDRDYKTKSADPIQNALTIARANLKEVTERIAWLESGAPGWTKKGSSYRATASEEMPD